MSVVDPGSPGVVDVGDTVGESSLAGLGAPRAAGRDVWRRFRRNRLALVGLAFIVVLAVLAVFAPLIAPYDPTALGDDPRAAPSGDHWFGTDTIGRDVFSRVVFGARISLRVGVLATLISLVIGVTLGAIAGYAGGLVDTVVMRITDVFLAIPYIVLAIAIATVFGRSVNAIILVLGLTGWLGVTRIVRASFLSIKQLEYVEAAVAMGYGPRRIMFRHILPNAMQPIIVYGTIAIAGVILSEAALSFLGVGPQDPTPAWGLMVSRAGGAALSTGPHMLFFPGAAIFLTVLAFVFVGDGLRDALDPRLR